MIDYMGQVASQEHLKDLYREAEQERFAREFVSKDANLLQSTRQMVGRNLVKIGEKLLDASPKPEPKYQTQTIQSV